MTKTGIWAAGNSGFAKKRVQRLIEHSTSYQHLWYIESLVLQKALLRKAAKRYRLHPEQVQTKLTQRLK